MIDNKKISPKPPEELVKVLFKNWTGLSVEFEWKTYSFVVWKNYSIPKKLFLNCLKELREYNFILID